ncbi:MAG: esterase/lipase family protein [Candidatus Helarchaeota archaeon]
MMRQKELQVLHWEPPAERTLLLVHGFGSNSTQFAHFMTNPVLDQFYNNIVAIDYYKYDDYSGNGLKKGFTIDTPIETIADALFEYIITHPDKFHKLLDIVAYSMGGLIVRSMIKRNYSALNKAGYVIDDVALIAAPNHGTALANPPLFLIFLIILLGIGLGVSASLSFLYNILLLIPLSLFSVALLLIFRKIGGLQAKEMATLPVSKFLIDLNEGDETPYGIDDIGEEYQDITWSTFYGKGFHKGHFLMFLINPLKLTSDFDGLVPASSVPLEGSKNYGPYPLNHDELLKINNPKSAEFFIDLFLELATLRQSI